MRFMDVSIRGVTTVAIFVGALFLAGCGKDGPPTRKDRAHDLMSSEDINKQVEGIRMMSSVEAGRDSIPDLMDLLDSENAQIRIAAAQTLTSLKAEGAAAKFESMIKTEADGTALYVLLEGIGTLKGQEAMIALCKPMLSGNESAKQQSTALLASFLQPGGPVPVAELVALAGSEDSAIRANVAAALGNTDPNSADAGAAKAALKKLSKDDDESVEAAAEASLTTLKQ